MPKLVTYSATFAYLSQRLNELLQLCDYAITGSLRSVTVQCWVWVLNFCW